MCCHGYELPHAPQKSDTSVICWQHDTLKINSDALQSKIKHYGLAIVAIEQGCHGQLVAQKP